MPTDCWKARAKWFGESPATEDNAFKLIFSPRCSSMNAQMRFFSTGERPPRLKSDASGMGMLLNMLKRGLEWTIASGEFLDRLVRASGGVSNTRHKSCPVIRVNRIGMSWPPRLWNRYALNSKKADRC